MSLPHDPNAAWTSQGGQSPSDVEPIELADDTPTAPRNSVPNEVTADLQCMTCGYSLKGLTRRGVCPECGTPVRDSVRGDLLFYRNPDYVKTLRKGLSLILNGLLLYIVLIIVVFMSFFAANIGGPVTLPLGILEYFGSVGFIGISVMILLGWWLFTTRDPGMSEQDEPRSRQITRIAAATSFVLLFADFTVDTLVMLGLSSIILDLLSFTFGILSLAAFVTHFFAGMLYTQRIARRMPSPRILQLTNSRMIACPIWATVGIILFFLGPLIALILYWNLLDMVRKALKTIIAAQESGHSVPPKIVVTR